jgi:MYXO-CTERM domain-containing protein
MKTKRIASTAVGIVLFATVAAAQAGVVFGLPTSGLQGGVFRWDAAARTIGGNERSLDGGLRYAVSTGSLDGFRDQFSWDVLPSSAAFTAAVQSAFNAWTVVDPVSKFGTALRFVYDPATAVVGRTGGGGANSNGAEIDLIATTDARFWNPGDTGRQGESWFNGIGEATTLTSGVVGYTYSRAISGADIYLNSNPGAVYSLDLFRRLLTHEIGHAIGFGDIEGDINPGTFIDDNFSAANAAGTLNNSWAALVNPLDPSGSALLARYDIGSAATASGVNLLMESRGLGISAANPIDNPQPLTNDEFGTRQFLYPSLTPVPEPATALMALAGLALLASRLRRQPRPAATSPG